MRHRLVFSLAVVLGLVATVASQAAPPRGLMQRSYRGGFGDCGCDAPVVYEPTCGCGVEECCDPCCTPCCLQIIPNLLHRTGCALHRLFQCNRCCETVCEPACDAGCSDCWHGGEHYDSVPVPEAEGVPMSRSSRAYQNWNVPRRSTASVARASRPVLVEPRSTQQRSVVKSKPARKPAPLSTRTASSARPIENDEQVAAEEEVVRRTSYSEPVKRSSRLPHNPLRD